MSRVHRFFQQRFERLGSRLTPPRSVDALLADAVRLAVERRVPETLALPLLHAVLRRELGDTANYPQRFVCDAGVGGLARWLRGSGYEAFWDLHLDDPAVIREAQRQSATLVTTDSLMMERGILRDGVVPAVFVPSTLNCEDQLVVLMEEMGLPVRESRCMACGGELRRVDKADVAHRIPPRTALWLQDYFVCAGCGKLFWRGTHWRRITERLHALHGAAKVAQRDLL